MIVHFLFWAVLPCVLLAWKENEAGVHESRSFEWLVKENENEYGATTTAECTKLIGLEFWESFKRSKTKICNSVHRYHSGNWHMLLLENVSFTSDESRVMVWETPFLDSQITITAKDCSDFIFFRHFRPFMSHFNSVSQMDGQCDVWIEEPLFILPWFDSTNWWHFTELALLPSFLYYGIAQEDLLNVSRNVHVATLRWPAERKYNTRHKQIYPTWVALPEILEKMIGPLRITPLNPFRSNKRECYRRVAWGSVSETYLDISHLNKMPVCFSSVLRSASDMLRSVMGVPLIGRKKTKAKVRIIYMKRDGGETWTPHQSRRTLGNQDEIVKFLEEECRVNRYEFEPLEFYYRDMKNVQEQIHAIGRSNVMIGVHGAGLGAMVALPPHSIVYEIRMGRNFDNHFMHLAHMLGHAYIPFYYQKSMNLRSFWSTLHDKIKQTLV